ncbi:MAG: glycosyltransferase [Clostridia bacterium]|nr:glycosyltransferase [Clostridia bacterium]MBQ3482875.1 glycosyltransferase [Clostridia bacterium]
MKVLWVTQGILPVMLRAIGRPVGIGGGWLDEPAGLLAADPETELTVVSPWTGKDVLHRSLPGMEYYLVPEAYMDRMKNPGKEHRACCKQLLEKIDPDVIHLHGSEFAGTLSFIEQSDKPKLLSIQGLISKINSDYFYGGIQVPSWLGCFLPWNIRTYLPMKLQHARNKWRARSEMRQLQQVDAVVGCTRWDYTYSKMINPHLGYYKVDYAIRREFSKDAWELETCDRHTLLVSSMAVPLKGMHKAIEALALLRKKYPDAKLRVVGHNIWAAKRKLGYAHYLYKKAKKLGVLDAIEVLGPQDVYGMVKALKSSHTFVLSSFIENGPNSMMEAMYLGVPCVCSYVGGAMQFAKEGKEALFYRFNETEILAYEIDRIWQNDELAQSLSEHAAQRAKQFETFEQVYLKYKEIYSDMQEQYKR